MEFPKYLNTYEDEKIRFAQNDKRKELLKELEEDEVYDLPIGLKPLPPIVNCKVKAIEEDNSNNVYYYDNIKQAALNLKIYARLIHYALDQENQSLYSKKLNKRLLFFKAD